MARPNTYQERKSAVRRIITAAKERGRITTRQAVEILGLHLNTVEKYFRDAEKSGEVIRHGKLGLFRDYRATINFDMERFSRQYRKGKQ